MAAPRPDHEAEHAWAAPTSRRRILLVAGEASGDLHAADLVTALRQLLPDVQVVGLGGERLREAGVDPPPVEAPAADGPLAGRTVVLTGRLEAGSREEIARRLESLGAQALHALEPGDELGIFRFHRHGEAKIALGVFMAAVDFGMVR